MIRMSFGLILLVGLLNSPVVFAAEVNCKTLERFILGKDGKRSKYFQKDGGSVDVVVYMAEADGGDSIVRVPGSCVILQSRFHSSLRSVAPGAVGMRIHIREETSHFRVLVQISELRPIASGVNSIPFSATDVDRVEKREVPGGLFGR